MAGEASPSTERVRAAEVVGALCLATDLGMGLPFEHGLRSTVIAMRLADRLGIDEQTASETYYACLLSYSGCTADAEILAETFGGALTTHVAPFVMGSKRELVTGLLRALPDPGSSAPLAAMQIALRLPRAARVNHPHLTATCEVAEALSGQLGLPRSVRTLFANLTERWDGKSVLRRAKGEQIPVALRIAQTARDAALQALLWGDERAVRIVRERAGHALDPEIATRLADDAGEILALDDRASRWEEALGSEPRPRLTLEGEAIDRALAAMGSFADLLSPYLAGHSAGVADLAATAARRCRLDVAGVSTVRRAALVHDLGRVAVAATTWQKRGPLTAHEWEQVRLHPYQTGRVLSRSPFLSALAPVAGAHHERLDGSATTGQPAVRSSPSPRACSPRPTPITR